MASKFTSDWFSAGKTGTTSTCFTLYCLPWSGGGTSFYQKWNHDIHPKIQVKGVCLPGREWKSQEKPSDDICKLSNDVATAIIEDSAHSGHKIGIFGHSMGVVTGFEVSRALLKRSTPIAHVFLSGSFCPSSIKRKENKEDPYRERWSYLSDETLLAKINELGGIPHELLKDKDYMENYFLPLFRADVRLSEDYWFDDNSVPTLDCPLTIFDGLNDIDHSVEEFQDLTSKHFDVKKYPGGHFYLIECRNKIMQDIVKKIRHLLDNP